MDSAHHFAADVADCFILVIRNYMTLYQTHLTKDDGWTLAASKTILLAAVSVQSTLARMDDLLKADIDPRASINFVRSISESTALLMSADSAERALAWTDTRIESVVQLPEVGLFLDRSRALEKALAEE